MYFHTHQVYYPTLGYEPSKTDADFSQRTGLSVHVINAAGALWQVSYGPNDIIPIPAMGPYMPYGEQIMKEIEKQ